MDVLLSYVLAYEEGERTRASDREKEREAERDRGGRGGRGAIEMFALLRARRNDLCCTRTSPPPIPQLALAPASKRKDFSETPFQVTDASRSRCSCLLSSPTSARTHTAPAFGCSRHCKLPHVWHTYEEAWDPTIIKGVKIETLTSARAADKIGMPSSKASICKACMQNY
jgi:hypothetical protein